MLTKFDPELVKTVVNWSLGAIIVVVLVLSVDKVMRKNSRYPTPRFEIYTIPSESSSFRYIVDHKTGKAYLAAIQGGITEISP